MNGAIGGVMPALPAGPASDDSLWRRWTGGWASVRTYVNAGAALAALLRARGARRVLIPDYVCPVVARAVAAAGAEAMLYPVRGALDPDVEALAPLLKDADAVVGVDYFGHPPGEGFRALKAAHPRPLWIEDRAQALDAGPAWGDAVIWSARKLVGVGDGGVMVSQGPLPEPDLPALDLWAAEDARAGDPEGRAPETWRPLFQAREAAMPLAPHAMNERTQAALKTVDAAAIAGARRTNWRRLAAALADMALWPIAEPDFVPLAFPIRVPDAAAAVQALAAHRIWAPRHWPELPSGAGEDALALSRRLVSLPLDQRYGEADMDRVIAAVRTI